jgi:hypothetical protein
VLNLNWHISSVIEAAEFRRRNNALFGGISFRLLNSRSLNGLVEREALASRALALFGIFWFAKTRDNND